MGQENQVMTALLTFFRMSLKVAIYSINGVLVIFNPTALQEGRSGLIPRSTGTL